MAAKPTAVLGSLFLITVRVLFIILTIVEAISSFFFIPSFLWSKSSSAFSDQVAALHWWKCLYSTSTVKGECARILAFISSFRYFQALLLVSEPPSIARVWESGRLSRSWVFHMNWVFPSPSENFYRFSVSKELTFHHDVPCEDISHRLCWILGGPSQSAKSLSVLGPFFELFQ